MENDDLTVRVLIEIRDRLDHANARIDGLRGDLVHGLDGTNQRLDEMRDDLGRRITASEIRTATEMTAVAGAVHDVGRLLRDRFDLRDRVDRVERDLEELKRRVG